MKKLVVAVLLFAGAAIATGCGPSYYAHYHRARMAQPDSTQMLSAEDIIRMSDAGISDSVIVQMLDASGESFQLRPRDVIALSDSGVSEYVISAMMQPKSSPQGNGEYTDYGGSYYPYYYYNPYWGWGYPYYSPWYFSVRFSPYYRSHGYYRSYAPLYNGSHAAFSTNHSSGFGGSRSSGGGGRTAGHRR